LWLILVVSAVAGVTLVVYVVRERLGVRGIFLAALRTSAIAALLLLLVNATRERPVAGGPVTVLLDASLSMDAEGGAWRVARDTARALAGETGRIVPFGDERVAPGAEPTIGRSLVLPALRAVTGAPGPVYLVTDGELEDAGSVPDLLLAGVEPVIIARATVPDAALRDASAPRHVATDDSLEVRVQVTTSGALADSTGTLEVTSAGRVLARRTVTLPPAPGSGQRTIVVPPATLAPGTHVVDVRLTAPGDREPRNDARRRVITVGAVPEVVVLASPPDWESRFLVRELGDVTGSAVRAFARIGPGRWVDMRTSHLVPEARVDGAVREAALVLTRGASRPMGPARALWRWPSADGGIAGDWYAVAPVPASPMAGRLGGAEWDSVPPITSVLPYAPPDDGWTGLSVRLARRGAERPLVLGRDSAGVRILTTTGDGLWRWALRGGAAREAYRTLLAAGVDWLLSTGRARAAARLSATEVVPQGVPATFRWQGETVPADPVSVTFEGPDTTRTIALAFDARGHAREALAPGVYRWRAPEVPGAAGLVVVEEYSDEFVTRPVRTLAGSAWEGARRPVGAREAWWVFAAALGAFFAEWAWRIRRGLP
jgi:hypothetical protein